MNDVEAMKEQASALRKQGKFEEAIALYRVLWNEHRDECNEWDGWGYAQCQRKTGHSQESLDICRQAYSLKPDFVYLRNLYGWCIYDLEIAGRDDATIEQNEARFFKAVNAILELVEPGQFTPFARTTLRVIDYYKKSRAVYPAAKILEWSGKLKPEQLSSEVGHGTDEKGQAVEFASDREKWYAARSKALFEMERFQECLDLGARALAEFPGFHHDNDVWIKWRMAVSKGELGDKEAAVGELQKLLSRKKDWFIQHRIAQFLYELGRSDEALQYAVDAALNAGDLEYKWRLFLLIGSLLKAQSKLDDAKKHVLLAAKVCQERDWKIRQALQAAIEELGVDMSAEVSEAALHEELKEHWKSLKLANLPHGQGQVKNLVGDERKSGFIRGDNSQEYYFKARQFQGPRSRLQVGMRVKFYIEKNPDPGKKDVAVYIEEIKP